MLNKTASKKKLKSCAYNESEFRDEMSRNVLFFYYATYHHFKTYLHFKKEKLRRSSQLLDGFWTEETNLPAQVSQFNCEPMYVFENSTKQNVLNVQPIGIWVELLN